MTSVADSKDTRRILGLQALRAVAATMIVVLHAEALVEIYADTHSYRFSPITWLPLGAGVDIFFVISGFVVVYASKDLFAVPGGTREFIRRRFIRIVPLYWTALTFRLCVLGVAAGVGAKAFPDVMMIATSYLFIPYDSLGYGSEYLFPILDLGWTLNYEMFFYLLLGCFLSLSRDRAVLTFAVCISAGVMLASILPPENDALRFWFRPIILEFAFGALIALLFFRGIVLTNSVRITMIATALTLWLSVQVSWFTDASAPGFYSWTRVLIWGIAAVLIVAAVALGPIHFVSAWSRSIASLGESSYALYLLHPFLFLFVKAALAVIVVPESLLWPLVFGTAAFAVSSAHGIYNLVERPVITLLKTKTVGFNPGRVSLK